MKPLIIYVDPECPDLECPDTECPDVECPDECLEPFEIEWEYE